MQKTREEKSNALTTIKGYSNKENSKYVFIKKDVYVLKQNIEMLQHANTCFKRNHNINFKEVRMHLVEFKIAT